VFDLFHRTYTKILMIFESIHNFLHKIKHKSNLHKKEKKKRHYAVDGPAARPAGRPSNSAHALRAPVPSHDVADSGPPLSASSPTPPAARPCFRPPLAGSQPALRCTAAPLQLHASIATTHERSTYLSLPQPHKWRTAASVARRPATRAR